MAVPWEAIGVVALLAVVFTGVSAYRLGRERRLRRGGVQTRALVVGHSENSTSDGNSTRSPILEFTTADGRTIRTSSPVSSDLPTALPGRVMTVYYNPASPEDVAIAGYGREVLRVLLLIGLLLFGVLAAMVFVPAGILLAAMPIFVPVLMGCAFLGIGGYGVGRLYRPRWRSRPEIAAPAGTSPRTKQHPPCRSPPNWSPTRPASSRLTCKPCSPTRPAAPLSTTSTRPCCRASKPSPQPTCTSARSGVSTRTCPSIPTGSTP